MRKSDDLPDRPRRISKRASALARTLVGIPSVNPSLEHGGAGEGAMARWCAAWLREAGFEVEIGDALPGRPNVVARVGSGAPRLILNGHLDTVGVGGMTVPPFGGEGEEFVAGGDSRGPIGDRVVGRGSADMKGGVAAILTAAAHFVEEGAPERGTLEVVLTADEEHASVGMAAYLEGGSEAEAAIVCEPTGLAIAPAHKGFLWATLRFRGVAAHGSRPERGVDAIAHAGRWLVAMEEYGAELASAARHPLLGPGTIHAGTIRGGSAPSVYPETCELVVERRTLPGEDEHEVFAEISRVAERAPERVRAAGVEMERGLFRDGTEVDLSHPLVVGLDRALRARGHDPRIEGMSAWVDAALLNLAGVPAVCFGPGSIEKAHAADEWAPAAEIDEAAEVLLVFLRGFFEEGTREDGMTAPGAGARAPSGLEGREGSS